MVVYKCQFCTFDLFSVKEYLSHYKLHNNVKNIVFPCCFVFCKRTFVRFTSLKCHMTRDHLQSLCSISNSLCAQSVQDKIVNDDFICCVDSCKRKVGSLKDLISHCKQHICFDQPMPCPYLNCDGLFTKHSSYTSHISRKHGSTGSRFKESFRPNSVIISTVLSDAIETGTTEYFARQPPENVVSDIEVDHSNEQNLSEVFNRSLALYFMKLEAVQLIPVSTINVMMSDVNDLHVLSIDIMYKKINYEVKLENSETKSKINHIMHSDDFKSLLSGDSAKFDTDFKRKRFFKQHFKYIEPIELYLGLDENNKRCVYHYVPLKETLKSLLEDVSVMNQINKPLACDKDLYIDITDGSSFKTNRYFQQNKDALKIILYQDAFEVVNPLGSAKKTFKLIGFYFSLVDIYPYNRAKIDPLQLAILCREKDFLYFDNGRTVLERLVSEIKELAVGLNIDGKLIKANLVCVLGDNLGSHFIGGFCTNFSNGQYYCRYCLMMKLSYETNPLNIRNAELRTVENFEHSVKFVEENNVEHHNGIKCNSIVNDINGFHVCNPALPPCLGHDLFEGVVKYDLALFLKNLINVKKWFDLKTLNFCISSFAYKGHDLDNKPVPIKAKCDNIAGHAVQTWTFLRLLPIIISEHVANFEDDVWKAILLLRIITEYLCSPKISINQVGIVQHLLDDYIIMRQTLFPGVNLRPKHHYVHHYPHLITQFGPMLRVWTMRFESKHTYFKRCIRSSKNFKNVTKTLSEKHQLLQSYYSVGSLFKSEEGQFEDAEKFSPNCVGKEIFDIVHEKVNNINNLRFSRSVLIHGYSIKSGNCVIVDSKNGYIGFGQIQFLLFDEDCIPQLLCKYISTRRARNGLYEVDFDKGDIVLVDYKAILDLCPLILYNNSIALKNYPVDKWN